MYGRAGSSATRPLSARGFLRQATSFRPAVLQLCGCRVTSHADTPVRPPGERYEERQQRPRANRIPRASGLRPRRTQVPDLCGAAGTAPRAIRHRRPAPEVAVPVRRAGRPRRRERGAGRSHTNAATPSVRARRPPGTLEPRPPSFPRQTGRRAPPVAPSRARHNRGPVRSSSGGRPDPVHLSARHPAGDLALQNLPADASEVS